jgi:hypothetical protein
MKKIKEAYKAGLEGNETPKDAGALRRIAHKLGKGSLERAREEARNTESAASRLFESALEQAKGPNITALEIIRAAAKLSSEAGDDVLRPIRVLRGDNTPHQGWQVSLSVPHFGRPNDNPRRVAYPFDELHLESLDHMGSGHYIPVRTLKISSDVAVQPDGSAGEVTTDIFVNNILYPSGTQGYSTVPKVTGAVKISLDSAGEVSFVGVERAGGISGYNEEQRDPHIAEFLESVKDTIDQTLINPPVES